MCMSDPIIQSTSYTSNSVITAAELRNPDTNAAFYVTMHANSTSTTLDTFYLKVDTSAGNRTLPLYYTF
jgi:hypothetical protein